MKKITISCAVVLLCSTALTFAGPGTRVIISGDHFPKSFRMDSRAKEGDYMANTVIFKVKSSYRQNCKANSIDNILPLQDLLNSVNAQNFSKMFPNHRAPEKQLNEIGMKLADISLIYSFKYTSTLSLEKVINQFLKLGYFEYVEPWYIPKSMLTPDDPSYGSQYHLQGDVVGSINTQTAWNFTTGNASVIVGIVDTGTEPTHPDLAANYAGGYDVAMSDTDPTWQGSNHGVLVSGDACAVTNNSVGVAGPGYNCRYKAVKIADASGTLIAGYTGIVWAADNGCKIINCSWGGAYPGTLGQDIIDYASINQNCLVIASAGNGGVEEFLWPSSYNGVYRVANTTSSDGKAGNSSYGIDVDYGAPGTGIYSTSSGGGYGSSSGTSMSSPVSAGAAALVQSQFNYTNAFQIGERLKQTCDPYAGTSTVNLFTAGKLGKGRIDVGKAVNSTIAAKSLAMSPITITDGNDDAFMPSETLTIGGSFINFLDPSSASASAVLSIISGPGTLVNSNYTIGAMATLATQTMATPFTVTIQSGASVNSVIKFKVVITDGTFTESLYFDVTVNPDYINIINNDVHTTITSKGKLGYNLDGTQQGLGFEYQLTNPPTQMLYEMSLLIGTSSTKVSDMFRASIAGDTDFGSMTRVYEVNPAVVSDFDVDGKFNDTPSPSPLPVEVHHSAYAWSTAPYRKFVIVKYVIKNTSTSALSNLYAGLLADWDITNAAQNKAGYDATNKMGYAYMTGTGGKFAAFKLLSGGAANNYIVDNGAGSGIDPNAGTPEFDTQEKYTVLSTSRNTDGFGATGGDVFDCLSTGPFTVNAGDSIIVAFAIIGGDNFADIQISACAAQSKYDNGCVVGGLYDTETDNFWMYNYPNPAVNSFNINYGIIGSKNASIRIMNALGEVVMEFNDLAQGKNTLTVDASNFSSGTYFYQLKSEEAVVTKKLTIIK